MNIPKEPLDESNFDDDPARELGGLVETELRLKKLRPRMPQVDIAAIEREADKLNTVVPLTASLHQDEGHRSWTRWVGPVAASWLCGVVFGGLFVSYAMPVGYKRPQTNETAKVEQPKQSEPNWDVAPTSKRIAADPSGTADRFELDGTLRLSGRFVKASEWMGARQVARNRSEAIANSADSNGIDNRSDAVDESIFSPFSPPSPLTQTELIRELLLESKQFVH